MEQTSTRGAPPARSAGRGTAAAPAGTAARSAAGAGPMAARDLLSGVGWSPAISFPDAVAP